MPPFLSVYSRFLAPRDAVLKICLLLQFGVQYRQLSNGTINSPLATFKSFVAVARQLRDFRWPRIRKLNIPWPAQLSFPLHFSLMSLKVFAAQSFSFIQDVISS